MWNNFFLLQVGDFLSTYPVDFKQHKIMCLLAPFFGALIKLFLVDRDPSEHMVLFF
jgi:hypothetical protein